MADALEIFKVVGAAAGIMSAGFFLYDRLVRIRPQAFLSNREYPGQIGVTIRNVSSETIILDKIGVSPNIIGVAKGDSVDAIVTAVMRRGENVKESSRKVFMILKPLEEMQLNLVPFDKLDKAAADRRVVIRFSWRTTRYRIPIKRNVKIVTSVFDLRAMKDAKEEVDE